MGNFLTSLQIFHARSCGIKVMITREIGNMSNLIWLDMGGNEFAGKIFDTLSQLRKLQLLSFDDNKLHGSIPSSLCNLDQDERVISIRNQFSCEIPSTIGKLQNLVYLTVSNNRLNGSILKSFGNLIALQSLDLSNNNLNGVIPMSMVKLEYLEYFNVSFNDLSGEIPNEGPFKNFTSEFFTGNREFCGASHFKFKPCKDNRTRLTIKTKVLKYIIPSIVAVLSLTIIVVYLIRRHGKNILLPTQPASSITIKRISYYKVLNATNKFGEENLIGSGYKGILSDDIGLGNNSLSGSLPSDICTNLPKLKKLRISDNQITSNIYQAWEKKENGEMLSPIILKFLYPPFFIQYFHIVLRFVTIILQVLKQLSGQSPVFCKVRNTVRSFGIRHNEKIGCYVIVRGDKVMQLLESGLKVKEYELLRRNYSAMVVLALAFSNNLILGSSGFIL
ncbi:probable LRR receptor-like serine threonine-kinase At3g47570 [Olea europaea subsp. europaea]|uniref:Probable LRR receptor-like serine threonine-kinase At3g47570 n=1 Tax=Olea europaea subsp. europaea TaxID=158383 RepID=A0A8S0TLB7_OLEEU|nr:probable LRR receptor-like serine threonine-kinase At3g47570 [Olea europaea subsp. europaea]